MMGHSETAQNPYVGPRAYEKEDRHRFYGRDREARELRALIVAEREVLFYAQSGAGKTSLLNARVIPALEEKGFRVLPIARVSGEIPPEIKSDAVSNIFVFSTLLSLAGEDVDPTTLLAHSLRSFLEEYSAKTETPEEDRRRAEPLVVIFDQFEELFTTHRDRWSDAQGFFEQVREVMDALPGLGVVFAMREDYIAMLDPYTSLFPHRLRARLRMERLRAQAALLAVKGPLTDTPRAFEEGVAEQLVEDLLKGRIETAPGKVDLVSGEFVEPVQLQVVCQNLWEDLPEDVTTITQDHLREFGDVNQALTEFYERSIRQVVKEAGVKESRLREWFEHTLITASGTRGTVYRGQEETGEIANTAVDKLQNLHLIRGEWRAGARWYELTHDRFIGPIQASNETWRAARRRQWFRLGSGIAAIFVTLFVLVVALTVQWTNFITQRSQEYKATAVAGEAVVEQSYELQVAATAGAEESNKLQATATAGAEAAAELVNTVTRVRTRPLRPGLSISGERSTADTLGAFVQDAKGGFYFLGAAQSLGFETYELGMAVIQPGRIDGGKTPDDVVATFDKYLPLEDGAPIAYMIGLARLKQGIAFETAIPGIGPIRGIREAAPGMSIRMLGRTSGLRTGEVTAINLQEIINFPDGSWQLVNCIATSPLSEAGDGGALAVDEEGYAIGIIVASSQQQTLLAPIQDVLDSLDVTLVLPGQELARLRGHNGPVIGALWLPDSIQIVTAGQDGTARLWNAWSGELIATLRGHQGPITALAFNPEGRWLVTASEDLSARVWDLTPNERGVPFLLTVLQGHRLGLTAVAFSPDGRWLVTASQDGTTQVWNTADLTGAPITLQGNDKAITTLAISPDSNWLVIGDAGGDVHMWDLTSLDARRSLLLSGHKLAITAMRFSSNGRWLVTGSQDHTARLWDLADSKTQPIVLDQGGDAVTQVAFSPDAEYLAVANADGKALLWAIQSQTQVAQFGGHNGPVHDIAWSLDGAYLTLAGGDGLITTWTVATEELFFTFKGHTDAVLSVKWSSDGTRIVTTSADGTARILQGK